MNIKDPVCDHVHTHLASRGGCIQRKHCHPDHPPVLDFFFTLLDQRKSQLHHFTIGFQKPGICADSWFLESNGKVVQLGFSLITSSPQIFVIRGWGWRKYYLVQKYKSFSRDSSPGKLTQIKYLRLCAPLNMIYTGNVEKMGSILIAINIHLFFVKRIPFGFCTQ